MSFWAKIEMILNDEQYMIQQSRSSALWILRTIVPLVPPAGFVYFFDWLRLMMNVSLVIRMIYYVRRV